MRSPSLDVQVECSEQLVIKGKTTMDFLKKYPIFKDLLKPFRLSQQKTCAAIVSALCQSAQASSFSIAGQLSSLSEVQFGSALNRFYLFLRNKLFDDWLLTEQMLVLLSNDKNRVLLCLDWTRLARQIFSSGGVGLCWDTFNSCCSIGLCEKESCTFAESLGGDIFISMC